MADPASDTTTSDLSPRVVVDGPELARSLARMAHQILEANRGADDLVLLGIPTRGVFLARRLAALIADICKKRHFGTAMGTFGTIFDIGHASGPILAGVLIAKWDYLHAFWLMAAILLIFVPVFMLSVDVDSPRNNQ